MAEITHKTGNVLLYIIYSADRPVYKKEQKMSITS